MGSLNPPELTLDCSLSSEYWVPKSTGEFLLEVSRTQSVSEKVSKLDDYVNRLQEEMKKIDAFKRALPLCMLLLTDVIATVKKELIQCKSSMDKPIIEEFIPLKEKNTDEKDETAEEKDISITGDKMNWMSSVQLWNSDGNPNSTDNSSHNKKRKEEVISRPLDDLFPNGKNRKFERGFEPLKGCNVFPVMNLGKKTINELSGVTELSLRTPEIKSSKEEISPVSFGPKSSCNRSGSSSATNDQHCGKEQTNRKQRRCWSAELHRRFVCALQQLGGPQGFSGFVASFGYVECFSAATPKQIRELMQVDGLTNDEVKSHLQKYRLHTRRVTLSANPSSGAELGGLWASHENCGEPSKASNSQLSSPQGPFTSTTGTDSLEDEEDEKWESHSWKGHNQISKKVAV
ncbi:homeodomain-like superfamily protein [Striga asiatica]|uniref:Homeodomain-like superfamily protein n=1 Tax=Striga asiatica TaxID=4170 RepID=A0A5A7R9P6_STRAF|nr:homeodomain-like superfamily protein [Striga asiatica]